MAPDINRTRKYLRDFDFKNLFIDELGWNHCGNRHEVSIDSNNFNLNAVAEKRGMVAFVCSPLSNGNIPDYAIRRKIERQIAKSVHEHLIIYNDNEKTTQIWQWVKREAGKPTACREHAYHIKQPGDSLIQKILNLAVTLDEEETVTIVDVTGKAKTAFDVEKVTKKFYDRFKNEHDSFLKFIEGIPDDELHRWYASVMLNRLMFIYFIQSKGFLNNDTNYLKNKLTEIKQTGKDIFYKKFLCPLFFEGFAKKASERSLAINKLLGEIPYLNGGLFLKHQIEELHGRHIEIADKAFEKLFEFFDSYQWHLDERLLKKDNEINPDVLGYIFEKYINQKQMGAYYTKEDITEYISKNTLIPFLFDTAKQKCKIAFEGEPSVWRLLQNDPDRYIYDAVKTGVIDDNGDVIPESALPDFVQKGIYDPKARMFDKRYNLGEADQHAASGKKLTLPTETWREYVERRKRCLELRNKLANGEIKDINDLITYNLNIRQFAQDVIENSEGPELLRAFYHAIEKVTVLDPTCGSGAFLFAALNILEPLYEACLDRMQVFIEEMEINPLYQEGTEGCVIEQKGDSSNRPYKKHRSDKYSDFKKILKRVSEHPNLKYFIYKSIIVNNLYGVDIMEEAIEICKLRLFLKLVAQIDSIEHIEPLPDIDFNIRAGNTLVGFATYDEVKRAVTSKLDFENTMGRIEEQAEEVDRLFKLFHQQQTKLGGEVAPEDKQELRKRLKALEDELNQYLAREYGINIPSPLAGEGKGEGGKVKAAYNNWLKTHHPFHWFIEFYGILKNGGFDVIIGNPPYVEYSKVKSEYTIRGYQTEDCGNLYAFVMEASKKLLDQKGYLGMIMPVSIGSTPRMLQLRKCLTDKTNFIYYSNFADRPSCLFSGVHQILSICIIQKGHNTCALLLSAGFKHWLKEEREILFDNLFYVQSTNEIIDYSWGKFFFQKELNILHKISRNGKAITSYLLSHGKLLAISGGTGGYWLRAFDEEQKSNEYKNAYVNDKDTQQSLCALINSSTFYWLWRKYSDCRHLTKSDIEKFTFALNEDYGKELIDSGSSQLKALKDTKELRTGKMTYEQYRSNKTKPIIDEIDCVLAKHYGFTDEELDFIINYDIKYRMGKSDEDEDDAKNL